MSDMPLEHIRNTLLETQEFDYHPEDWQVVDRTLRPRRKKRWLLIFFFTGLGLIAGVALVSQLWNNRSLTITPSEHSSSTSNDEHITEFTGRAEKEIPVVVSREPVENSPEKSQTLVETVKQKVNLKEVAKYNIFDHLPPRTNEGIELQTAAQIEMEPVLDQESETEEEALKEYFYPVFLPIKPLKVIGESYTSIQRRFPVGPNISIVRKTPRISGHFAVGLAYPLGNKIELPGNNRTPQAVGQSFQGMFYLNEKNSVGLKLRHQKSFSFNDSLAVATANQWYPDWSDGIDSFYETFDVEQRSLTLDLSFYRNVFNRPGMKVHMGLGTRLSLLRDQRVDTVLENVYFGTVEGSNQLSFKQVFRGFTPELMVDVPIYKRLGISFGMEYFIPVKNVGLDIESPLSGFTRLYYDF